MVISHSPQVTPRGHAVCESGGIFLWVEKPWSYFFFSSQPPCFAYVDRMYAGNSLLSTE